MPDQYLIEMKAAYKIATSINSNPCNAVSNKQVNLDVIQANASRIEVHQPDRGAEARKHI